MKTWQEMTEEIGKAAYVIEMAEGMIPKYEAERRWEEYFASVRGKTHTCNHLDQIVRTVGSALIAMEKLGMVSFK